MEIQRESCKKHLNLPYLRINCLQVQEKYIFKVCGTLFLEIPKRGPFIIQREMSETGGPETLVTKINGNFVEISQTTSSYNTSQYSELELFGLSDTNFIVSLLAPLYGNTPASSVSYSGQEFAQNLWQPIQTNITVLTGIILQNATSDVVLATTTLYNNSDGADSFPVNFSQFLFTSSYNVVWSSNAAYIAGTKTPIQIIINDSQGNSLYTIQQNWNTNTPHQESQTQPSAQLSQKVEVPPISSIQASLYATKKVKTFRIFYSVALSGTIAVNLTQPLDNLTSWPLNVFMAQYLGNLPTSVMVTQDITVSVYENPTITFGPATPL